MLGLSIQPLPRRLQIKGNYAILSAGSQGNVRRTTQVVAIGFLTRLHFIHGRVDLCGVLPFPGETPGLLDLLRICSGAGGNRPLFRDQDLESEVPADRPQNLGDAPLSNPAPITSPSVRSGRCDPGISVYPPSPWGSG